MRYSLSLSAVVLAAATPAVAQETFTVPFNTVSTGSAQQYSNLVRVNVSGSGFSRGRDVNDAFYFTPSGSSETSGYYQLGFGTSPLTPFDAGSAVVNRLGQRPAFNLAGLYTFTLNVGATPTNLYFGVTDGQFSDNGGAYQITLTSVPEPATWALMIAGFGLVGYAMRRRRTTVVYA